MPEYERQMEYKDKETEEDKGKVVPHICEI